MRYKIIITLLFANCIFHTACPAAQSGRPDITTNTPQGREYHDAILSARLTSPRATWVSLIELTRAFNDSINEKGFTYQNRLQLEYLEEQIAQCFDLRETPPSTRVDTAMETAVYLCEVLARFTPYPTNRLPDREAAFQEIKDGKPGRWHIHGTAIAIALTREGDYTGSFQFTPQTIDAARQAYQNLSHLSYMDSTFSGFYTNYFLTPGPAIPVTWIRKLPSWTSKQYRHNALWQWTGFLLGLLCYILFACLVIRTVNRFTGGRSTLVRCLLHLLTPVLCIAGIVAVTDFIAKEIFATGELLLAARFIQYFIVLCASVYIIISLGNLFAEWAASSSRVRHQGIDSYLLRLGVRLLTIVVSVVIIMEGLQRMGFSLATVLAGAGVTGLAIALAAQESLRNIFGSIMLLLDKPFVVGQRVKIRGHDGVVEGIGLRSTKIRLLSGHLSSIPNEDVARADIENIGARPFIRKLFSVTITYDTPPEKIDEAIAILRDIVALDKNDPEKTERNWHVNSPEYPPRIYFNDLNADSLNLLVVIWYVPADYWDYLDFCHYLNREIIRRFNQAGINFAFPSHTVYMAGNNDRPFDAGVDMNAADGHLKRTAVPPVQNHLDHAPGSASDATEHPHTPLEAAPLEEMTEDDMPCP
jgi:MscS family membrane protein